MNLCFDSYVLFHYALKKNLALNGEAVDGDQTFRLMTTHATSLSTSFPFRLG